MANRATSSPAEQPPTKIGLSSMAREVGGSSENQGKWPSASRASPASSRSGWVAKTANSSGGDLGDGEGVMAVAVAATATAEELWCLVGGRGWLWSQA